MISTLTKKQLKDSLNLGSAPNDLLPPRAGDRLGGQFGNRFISSLHEQTTSGNYRPVRADSIPVPKTSFNTRPASLLTLKDRVVYAALVERLRDRIEGALLPEEVVFFPRGISRKKKWKKFEEAPSQLKTTHIVVADVAGFYESVNHSLLKSKLLTATGRTEEVEELCNFLGEVMGRGKGIPQGHDSSDALATIYLSPVDDALIREGFDYFRHGDDMRVAVASFKEGRRALYSLENSLRQCELLPNGLKCRILKTETYSKRLDHIDSTMQEYSQTLQHDLAEKITTEDDLNALKEVLGSEKFWEWYRNGASPEEMQEEVARKVKPSEIAIAKEVFKDRMSKPPGGDNHSEAEAFHQLLSKLITIFSAVKDPEGLGSCVKIATDFPDKTGMIANYLKALAGAHKQAVTKAIEELLYTPGFRSGWELASLIEVVSVSGISNKKIEEKLWELAKDENIEWIARVEATNALGKIKKLTQEHANRMWRLAPILYRGEIVKAVTLCLGEKDWASIFLATVNDPEYTAIKGNA